MAKAFEEAERKVIEKKLMQAAEASLHRTGISKTSVDSLAQAAGISKGSFYLFFKTKEELFFRVIMEYHESVEKTLLERLDSREFPGEKELSRILRDLFRETASSFFPPLLASGELALLQRRLSPETLGAHSEYDSDMFASIVSRIPRLAGLDAEAYSAAFRGLFLLALHRDEIGAAQFDRALDILVDGAVRAMFADAGRLS